MATVIGRFWSLDREEHWDRIEKTYRMLVEGLGEPVEAHLGKEPHMSGPRQEAPKGCTVGVIQIPDGILFFKNRDLASQYLTNRTTVWQSTPDYHVLRGANLETGELQGIAIGVNRQGICVANTHLCSTPDVTYDLLCEDLVRRAQSREDVPTIVEGFMAEHTVQGGKILVASTAWTLLVEVLGDEFQIQDFEDSFVMTNNFSLISHEPERAEIHRQSSRIRHEVAWGMIQSITSIGALEGHAALAPAEKGSILHLQSWLGRFRHREQPHHTDPGGSYPLVAPERLPLRK